MRPMTLARPRTSTAVSVVLMLCGCIAMARPAAAQSPPSAVAVAATAQAGPALIGEPRILTKGITWVEHFGRDDTGRLKDGFYPEFGRIITGAGWISLGPGYRQHLFEGRALVDASAALSWRAYTMAQARFELPYLAGERVSLGAQYLWHDFKQVRYFGTGAESLDTGASDYRVKATHVVAYATWRARPAWTVTAAGGWQSRPDLLTSGGLFDRNEPDAMRQHPQDAAASLVEQPSFLHAAAAVAYDSRDSASYPRSGGMYRASAATYRDRVHQGLSFDRFEVEAARFVPVAGDRGVLALHWWTVLSHTDSDHAVPFYLLPSVGGHNTLRGYAEYRFHDRHLMVVTCESRWALLPHVDGAVFFDAGSVAGRARDLDFRRTSAGVGVRVHASKTTLARVDVAHSEEGWRLLFKLSDPLRFSRVNRRTAALPFVP